MKQFDPGGLPCALVLGARINALTWDETVRTIGGWASARESRYVCVSNVHMVIAAHRDQALADAMRLADMATPDGAPIAWMLRWLGYAGQPRISGTELMRAYLAHAASGAEPVFFYGSTPETMAAMLETLKSDYPGLTVAGSVSPPFRLLTADEDAAAVAQINASGAGTVWVSLGCPKQEKWMLEHRGKVNAVMLGVGAAFDFIAGNKARAPTWMQRWGLEWLHRFASEPGRLWKRYLVTNCLFVVGVVRQLLFSSRR